MPLKPGEPWLPLHVPKKSTQTINYSPGPLPTPSSSECLAFDTANTGKATSYRFDPKGDGTSYELFTWSAALSVIAKRNRIQRAGGTALF